MVFMSFSSLPNVPEQRVLVDFARGEVGRGCKKSIPQVVCLRGVWLKQILEHSVVVQARARQEGGDSVRIRDRPAVDV